MVLSLLLFSFAFVVLHDYAMQSLEAKVQSSISGSQVQSAVEESRVLIHDCIHMLLAFSQPRPPLCFLDSPKSRLLYSKLQPTSHSRHVLERPPLS